MTSATGRGGGSPAGLTLVELVIALSVLGILVGLAVPAIDGVQRERVAREPVNELLLMAREVRLRAMSERRPYQIVFDREGFRASRYFHPYGGAEEFDQLRVELELLEQRDAMAEASRRRMGDLAEGPGEDDPRLERIEEGLRYHSEYLLDPALRCSVKFWNDLDWTHLHGGERRRWIFQPSGMCEPLTVRIEADRSFFEVEFHPLTADVKRERSWVE